MQTLSASCIWVSTGSRVCCPGHILPASLAFCRGAAWAAERGVTVELSASPGIVSCVLCVFTASVIAVRQIPRGHLFLHNELSVINECPSSALVLCRSLFCLLLMWPLCLRLPHFTYILSVCAIRSKSISSPGTMVLGLAFLIFTLIISVFFIRIFGPFTCNVLTGEPTCGSAHVLFRVCFWTLYFVVHLLLHSFIVKIFPVNYPFTSNYSSLCVFLHVALWGGGSF